MDDDHDAEDDDLLVDALFLDETTAAEVLVRIVTRLNEPVVADPNLCGTIGAGPLETLLRDHETELWPEVERLARADTRFRRALRSVWAYDSPEFARREALLADLGESHEITVRFTVEPDDFSSDPELSWRAFETEGHISKKRLAEVLRNVAGWLESPDANA